MMRQKYVVRNILQEFYVEDTQLQLLWGVKKSNVTSVTNYCCRKVISKVTILLLKGVTSNE